MDGKGKALPVLVEKAEAGQKLVQFLLRRLGPGVPVSLVHRIIRSGEVRVDGRRAAPFSRLAEGQRVRIPPVRRAQESADDDGGEAALPIRLVARTPELLVLDKPRGLPVHGGSGHADSLTRRVRAHFPRDAFAPTPVHRLDRDTTGLVLMARTYEALARLNALFARKTSGDEASLRKEYLVWVRGEWKMPEEGLLLHDRLEKKHVQGYGERMIPSDAPAAMTARVHVRSLAVRSGCTLLLAALQTGRTHQIRAQLAARGHPVVGDGKYGGQPERPPLLLHAWRLALPNGERYETMPDWPPPFAVPDLSGKKKELP